MATRKIVVRRRGKARFIVTDGSPDEKGNWQHKEIGEFETEQEAVAFAERKRAKI